MAARDADQNSDARNSRATGSGTAGADTGAFDGMVGMARVPFGEALRYYRKQAGLTQTELAERAGMGTTQAAVALAEKSNTPLRNKERMNALARALNISPSALAIGLIPSEGSQGAASTLPQQTAIDGFPTQTGQIPYLAVDAGLMASPYTPDAGPDLLGERLEELEKRLRDVQRFLSAVQQSIATLEHLANSAQEVVSGTMSEIAQIRSDALHLGSAGQSAQSGTGSAGRGRAVSRSGR